MYYACNRVWESAEQRKFFRGGCQRKKMKLNFEKHTWRPRNFMGA
jgi:hypothetical protein